MVDPYPGFSGVIQVSTPTGSAKSAQDLFCIPSGASATTAIFLGEIVVDGNSVSVVIGANQTAYLLFTATSREVLGLGASAVNLQNASLPAQIAITDFDGNPFAAFAVSQASSFVFPTISRPGTYIMAVNPGASSTGLAVTLTLSKALTGSLASNGNAVIFSGTRMGQDGRYFFKVANGDALTLVAFRGTFPGSVWITDPNGVAITTVSPNPLNFAASGQSTSALLAALGNGTYTALVQPTSSTGSVSLSLVREAVGGIAIDGNPKTVVLSTDQRADFTFNGTSGDYLSLGLASVSTAPAGTGLYISVITPGGAPLMNTSVAYGPTYYLLPPPPAPGVPPPLTASGTYQVEIVPTEGGSATLQLLLSHPQTGKIVVGGPAVTFTGSRVGQYGLYTFKATAKEANVSLQVTNTTLAGYIAVNDANGISVGSANLTPSQSASIAFPGLSSETYTVAIIPSGATLGSVSFYVGAPLVGNVVVDGNATTVALNTNEHGAFSFTGNANDNISIGIPSIATTPAYSSVSLSVVAPNGSVLSQGLVASTAEYFVLPTLPLTGTYVINIVPATGASANLQLIASHAFAGTLVANSTQPTTYTCSRVGQYAIYTFAGVVGQGLFLELDSNFPVTGEVQGPAGNVITEFSAQPYKYSMSPQFTVPVTGAYTVFLYPTGAAQGQLAIMLF